jgi:hypothetical protein
MILSAGEHTLARAPLLIQSEVMVTMLAELVTSMS